MVILCCCCCCSCCCLCKQLIDFQSVCQTPETSDHRDESDRGSEGQTLSRTPTPTSWTQSGSAKDKSPALQSAPPTPCSLQDQEKPIMLPGTYIPGQLCLHLHRCRVFPCVLVSFRVFSCLSVCSRVFPYNVVHCVLPCTVYSLYAIWYMEFVRMLSPLLTIFWLKCLS